MLYAQIGAMDAKLRHDEQEHMNLRFEDLGKKSEVNLGFTVARRRRRGPAREGLGAWRKTPERGGAGGRGGGAWRRRVGRGGGGR